MGGWILGAVILTVLFLGMALACPVYYECALGQGRNVVRIRFLLFFHKTFRLDRIPKEKVEGKEETGDGAAPSGESGSTPGEDSRSGPAAGETPIRLTAEGRRMEGASLEKKEADGKEAGDTGPMADGSSGKEGRRSWLSVLAYAQDNGALSLVLDTAAKMLRHSWPAEMSLTGQAGFGDPMKTGLAAGACMAALPGICCIDWQYNRPCLAVQWTMKGYIIPVYLAFLAVRFLTAEPVRSARAYREGKSI